MCNRDTSSDFRFTTSSISFDYQLKFKNGYLEWTFKDRLIVIKSNLHEEGNNSWLQKPILPKHQSVAKTVMFCMLVTKSATCIKSDFLDVHQVTAYIAKYCVYNTK